MENCKADIQKLLEIGQGLSINSCSVDVSTIKSPLLKQQIYLKIPRISHQRCSRKKVFVEILQNSQENTCARASFLSLRSATLLKKRLWRRCFPANFVKLLRTPFLQNISGQLLLNAYSTCGAGLQSGTSLQFHFLRFFLFGKPIFRNT